MELTRYFLSPVHVNVSQCQRVWHPLVLAYLERSLKVPLFVIGHPYMLFAPSHMLIAFNHYILKPVQDFLPTYSGWIWTFGCPVSIIDSNTSKLEAFESIISNSSRICIRVNRNTATVDETVNIFPSVSSSIRHPVCWDLWNPTGLTALTLDTIRFLNKANLDDIYNALPSTCHAI